MGTGASPIPRGRSLLCTDEPQNPVAEKPRVLEIMGSNRKCRCCQSGWSGGKAHAHLFIHDVSECICVYMIFLFMWMGTCGHAGRCACLPQLLSAPSLQIFFLILWEFHAVYFYCIYSPFSNTSQIHPTPYLPNFSVSLSFLWLHWVLWTQY